MHRVPGLASHKKELEFSLRNEGYNSSLFLLDVTSMALLSVGIQWRCYKIHFNSFQNMQTASQSSRNFEISIGPMKYLPTP